MGAPVLTLEVQELIAATPSTRILRLALDDLPFTYRAGQGVLLGMHGKDVRKPYSIASAPHESREHRALEFLLKTKDPSEPASHLLGLTEGMLVDLEGPLGSFYLPEGAEERRFLFIAGGTGIAPLRAMLRHALHAHPAPESISVVYSVRSPLDFAYGDELQKLASDGRISLQMTVTRSHAAWGGERGRIDKQRLAPLVADPATLCFICGPESLVGAAVPLLRDLGVAPKRIRTEEW